ncbi:MAG: hypothetical protein U1E02_34520 [Hydrogenophaga sp.]|nr:hypothetical protein [Hydrogenophaga sp.]
MAALVGAGFGYTAVLHMPWTEARDFAPSAATAAAQQSTQAMLQAAIAARMAQVSADDWKKWVRTLGAGP